MNRSGNQPPERPRRNAAGAGRHAGSLTDDPAWADAEQAAAELRRELDAVGDAADFVGLRVVRNVVGRPVVQLGTVEPNIARELAGRIRARTRADTLRPVRHPGP